jgi:hypothetical protein
MATKDLNAKSPPNVEAVAEDLYKTLAGVMPVCSASDEFHFFPQVESERRDWSLWDDFSPEAVRELAHKIKGLEQELVFLEELVDDVESLVDISTLIRIARTLREQLIEVKFWRTQPTFYLTVASIGLAEALESADPGAWDGRVRGLPGFLDRARENLTDIPAVFRDLGLEMTADTGQWLASLSGPGLGPVIEALDRFENHLEKAPVRGDFMIPIELMERITRYHIGCGAGVDEAGAELDREIQEMREIMDREAARLDPGRSWQEVMDKIHLPELPEDGLVGLYRAEVEKLGLHCLDRGFVSEEAHRENPVRVAPVPSYLSAIRSAAAYSMPPGHPPQGGTFYLIDVDAPEHLFKTLHRDCRMLCAHETYPGHHLLDLSRWGLENRIRRPIEFPLFYEGWACFGEELLVHTGYFSEPTDRLQLARRHFWRAVRGKIDLGLQTGKMDLEAAANYLAQSGMDRERAAQVVKRYTLKPGYQLCYTLGLRRFRALFERCGQENPGEFAREVLSRGEVGFEALEGGFRK